MNGNGEAVCSNARFSSFPPFPPRKEGCPEWCGTQGNAKIYSRTSVKKFVLTNVTIDTFNKEAFRQYPNVEEITFSKCSLPTLRSKLFFFKEREHQSKITSFSIFQSKIEQIEANAFYGLHALENLSLGRNHLTRLPGGVFDHLTSLRYLFLSGNRLSNLDPALFKNLQQLEELHLSENPLKSLGTYPELPRLRSLYLKATSLNVIETDTFSQLDMLDTLDLSENKLKSLPANVFSQNQLLARIYLKDNNLEDLPGEVFSSLCHLNSLDLSNNQLSTPKVGYMASIFDNKNNPQEPDLATRDLTGNPWKCNDINEDLKEYTLFVSTVYHYAETQTVRHGLLRYINIRCIETDEILVDPSTMSSPVLNYFTETHRSDLMLRNNCPLLESKIPKKPACPFISPTCNGTRSVLRDHSPPERITQDDVPIYYFFIGGGLLGVIGVLLIWNCRTRHSVKRRRHFSAEHALLPSSPSVVSPLRTFEVEVSEVTVQSSKEVPPSCNNEMGHPPNPTPANPPLSPLEPETFSFSTGKSNSNLTLCENKHDDVINDAASLNSETEAKELYQPGDSGRISSSLTRPKHAHLSKPNDFKGEENIYEKKEHKQPSLPDNSGYAAANFIPCRIPQAMPGYETMCPIGGACYITMDDELLPGNPHRPLPSFPVEYSVMSQHPYESIKNNPPPDHPAAVNHKENEDSSASDPVTNQSLCGFPANGTVDVNAQFLANYSFSQATQSSNAGRTATNRQQQGSTDCQEDEDGYLLPHVVQHQLQAASSRLQNERNFVSERPLEGTSDRHCTTGAFTTYSTFVEDGKEYILPNMENTAEESDRRQIHESEEPWNLRQHDSTDVNQWLLQDPDLRGGDAIVESEYLFSEETAKLDDIGHSHSEHRPISQQLLIDNME